MSRSDNPGPRVQGRKSLRSRKRSMGLSHDEIRIIDIQLDRIFNEYWEGSHRSKAVLAQQRRKELLTDAARRVVIDEFIVGDDSGLDEPSSLM